MSAADAAQLRVRRVDGQALAATVTPEAKDPEGRVTWVRVAARTAIGANGRLPVELVREPSPSPSLDLQANGESIEVRTADYTLRVRAPGQLELSAKGRAILAGDWSVEAIGDTRAVLWGANWQQFVAQSAEVESRASTHATIVLKGIWTKNERKAAKLESGRVLACELRLRVDALSPQIGIEWRLTNLTGVRTWLQRYALRLPLAAPATRLAGSAADRLLLKMADGGAATLTADFVADLGRGAGVELSGQAVAIGGLAMPPDGGYQTGRVPDIHRQFHQGMSRTFTGTLLMEASTGMAAEALAPLDLVLPAQYYSDVKALPEAGDPVTFGPWEKQIRQGAEWLLANQWRGTLYWGEWYREWDETRNQGVQEASNGHSCLAPLYHYWRTGDARFLQAARRSAWYVWDVQLSKSEEKQGRMFHTRRHLFDELDWIHARYQRAAGTLLASHVFLNGNGRREGVETIRSFYDRMFDERGAPHDWDTRTNRRADNEAGVDVSNFMEALVWSYRETGEREFLERALKMSRWTGERWKQRGRRAGDDWNWNLTNYAERGLLSLYDATQDPATGELAAAMTRAVLANPSTNVMELIDGVGGGDAHFVFYHAWLSTRVAKYARDGDRITQQLGTYVEREMKRVRPDGLITLEMGLRSGLPTRWTSYYDAKSMVAYVPVYYAHLRGRAQSGH